MREHHCIGITRRRLVQETPHGRLGAVIDERLHNECSCGSTGSAATMHGGIVKASKSGASPRAGRNLLYAITFAFEKLHNAFIAEEMQRAYHHEARLVAFQILLQAGGHG